MGLKCKQLWMDICFSVRHWSRMPLTSLLLIVTFAVGIGANSAVFTMVNQALLKPLPFGGADRLVYINGASGNLMGALANPASFLAQWKESRSFAAISAYHVIGVNLSIPGSGAHLQAAAVSTDFFEVFGTKFLAGHAFSRVQHEQGENHLVIVSENLWRKYWADDPNIIGRTIEINGLPRIITGVAAHRSSFPSVDLWIPAFSSTDLIEGGFCSWRW